MKQGDQKIESLLIIDIFLQGVLFFSPYQMLRE